MRLSEGIGLTDKEIGPEARWDCSWLQNYWEAAFFIAACNTGVHIGLKNYDPCALFTSVVMGSPDHDRVWTKVHHCHSHTMNVNTC